jgi:hypothetical protein
MIWSAALMISGEFLAVGLWKFVLEVEREYLPYFVALIVPVRLVAWAPLLTAGNMTSLLTAINKNSVGREIEDRKKFGEREMEGNEKG